jgi:hypothetical protein
MPALADFVVVRRAPLCRRMGGADAASDGASIAGLAAVVAVDGGLIAVVAVAALVAVAAVVAVLATT